MIFPIRIPQDPDTEDYIYLGILTLGAIILIPIYPIIFLLYLIGRVSAKYLGKPDE